MSPVIYPGEEMTDAIHHLPQDEQMVGVVSEGNHLHHHNHTLSTSSSNDYDYYEYDLDESLSTYYWDELLPPLTVYIITIFLGILGNSLIIYTISRYNGMKSTTNVFLASLASADLLLILVCVPV
ncbi:hypothetical protein OTU49_015094, partial [Cherax quadricarinatus]